MKVWLDPKSTLPVDGKTVRYGKTFDEKKISPELLKKYQKEGKVGDKVATEKDLEKVADKRIVDLKSQFEDEKKSLIAGYTARIEKIQAKLEGSEGGDSELEKEVVSLKSLVTELQQSVTDLTAEKGSLIDVETSLRKDILSKDEEIAKLKSEGISDQVQAKLDDFEKLVEALKKCDKKGDFVDVVESLESGDNNGDS